MMSVLVFIAPVVAYAPHSMWCVNACVSMRWLHIPKTGSTFGNLVYRYACNISANVRMPSMTECSLLPASHPWKSGRHSGICSPKVYALEWALPLQCPIETCCHHLQSPFVQHKPVDIEKDSGKLVAMFRDPSARLQSTLDMMSFQREQGLNDFHFMQKIGASNSCMQRLQMISSHNATVEEFAQVGATCARACQTKMVLGHECAADVALSNSDGIKACNLVNNSNVFLFVGVTERWHDAVKHFHRQFGGNIDPRDLSNTRPTSRKHALLSQLRPSNPDPIDRVLYECVAQRIRHEVALI